MAFPFIPKVRFSGFGALLSGGFWFAGRSGKHGVASEDELRLFGYLPDTEGSILADAHRPLPPEHIETRQREGMPVKSFHVPAMRTRCLTGPDVL